MQVKILGSAAGGGLPQWNCNCSNCKAARQELLPRRTQSTVAFSPDGRRWFLINASPDIRFQLDLIPESNGKTRRSPIEAVLLNNADLDHVLGLLLLREGSRLSVHASESVRRSVSKGLHLDDLLSNFCGIKWRPVGTDLAPLLDASGAPTGLRVRAISLGGSTPRYCLRREKAEDHAIGFVIEDESSGGRCVCALDMPSLSNDLAHALKGANLAIIDGTFWSDDEMIAMGFSTRSASDMGHLPVGGVDGSLQSLSALREWKGDLVYSHINNTNPILPPGSPEREEVLSAGAVVAEDGMEWVI